MQASRSPSGSQDGGWSSILSCSNLLYVLPQLHVSVSYAWDQKPPRASGGGKLPEVTRDGETQSGTEYLVLRQSTEGPTSPPHSLPPRPVRGHHQVDFAQTSSLTPGHLLHNHHEPLLDATSLWSWQTFLTSNCEETSPPQTPHQGLMAAKAFPLVLK